VRTPRFLFLLGSASLGSLALVVAIGSGTACSFSHDAGSPDTFIPEQDTASDNGLVQQPVSAFDTVSGTDVEPDIDSCKDVPYDGGVESDAVFDGGPDGSAPGGTLIDVGIVMYSFGTGNTEVLPGAKIDVFLGNKMNGASPDIVGAVADDKGIVHIQAPAGWRIAYHIAEKPDSDPTKALKAFGEYDVQLPYVAGEPVAGSGVTGAEDQTLTFAITNDKSFVPPPGTAVFATRVVDCKRRTMANATLEIFDVDTGANVGPFGQCKSGVCRIYMGDNELPNFSLPWTSRAGLVVVANLDASHHYRAIAKGKRAGSPDVETLGTKDIELQPDTIDVSYIYP
jgi:hypothetical protein